MEVVPLCVYYLLFKFHPDQTVGSPYIQLSTSGAQARVDFLSPHFDQFVFHPPVGVWGISSG
jgi:hypothetical protein